jgi:hypothetical protein
MKRLLVVALALVVPFAGMAQERKTAVSVTHKGQDQIGSLFVAAFNQELLHSARYEPMASEGAKNGLRFYVDITTVDVATDVPKRGQDSAISVVIEEMGFPNSFPVPDMWYHKLVIVDRKTAEKVAKELLGDLDAAWCNHITNSVGGCPKENL